jgi:hypothetical protein
MRTDAAIADVCTAAYAELERLRSDGQANVRAVVMHCVALCFAHNLAPPAWLRQEFLGGYALVNDAHVGSWDEAYGRPWPKGTRLKSIRMRKRVKTRVHHEVFAMVAADMSRAIKRDLFEEVGEMRGIGLSGSVVEKLYYEATAEGALNVAMWRDQARRGAPGSAIPNCSDIQRT